MFRPRLPLRRGPGLLRTMGRTAVVAGTAAATVGAVNRHAQNKAEEQAEAQQWQAEQEQAQYQAMAQQAQPIVQAAPAPPSEDDLVAKISQLASLHASGVLSDDEFAAAKAKLLN